MRHLIDAKQLDRTYINKLMDLANDIINNPCEYKDICKGKILSSLFYESSTRTRLSFEAAILELGGNVIGFSNEESSSASKGESVADTVRVVSTYSDICVIRHNKEGAALVASKYSQIPVINAGDGGHQHPSQTLTDLFTIQSAKNTLEGHTIGLCGDLKFGRTVHSLLKALAQYKNNKFILISPIELKVPKYIKEQYDGLGIEYEETTELESSIEKLDILYMTRVQKERFFNEEDYVRLKDTYHLDRQKLEKAKKDMIVLHPLPRVNEISIDVDKDPRAYYFKQVKYGKEIRKALILDLLDIHKEVN